MEQIYSTQEALDLAKEVYNADDIENTEVGEFVMKTKAEDLVLARIPMRNAEDSTKIMKNFADDYIKKDVMEKGTFKLNDTVFHATKPYKYQVFNMQSFFKWLVGDIGDDKIELICAVVGGTFVPKLRALDAITELRGGKPQVIRDTFLGKIEDENKRLLIINCNSASAPKWAQNMEEGERFEGS
jgi:hypothetical protein